MARKTAKVIGRALTLAVFSFILAGCAAVRTPSDEILVDAQWIADQGNGVTILDVARSQEDFLAGHIPGAALVDRAIVWDTVNGIAGMLPDPELVAAELADLGVSNDKPVVVYDSGNGLWAARVFWALEYLGHNSVHLLDGGYAAYSASGAAISTEPQVPARGEFVANVQEDLLTTKEFILENLENDAVVVVDTRSAGEFQGSDVRAAKGGHIPGSVHIEWRDNLSDNSFKQVGELDGLYSKAAEKGDRIVTLCQTGVRGAHSYVALRVAGYESPSLYDGSWAEWGNDDETPVQL